MNPVSAIWQCVCGILALCIMQAAAKNQRSHKHRRHEVGFCLPSKFRSLCVGGSGLSRDVNGCWLGPWLLCECINFSAWKTFWFKYKGKFRYLMNSVHSKAKQRVSGPHKHLSFRFQVCLLWTCIICLTKLPQWKNISLNKVSGDCLLQCFLLKEAGFGLNGFNVIFYFISLIQCEWMRFCHYWSLWSCLSIIQHKISETLITFSQHILQKLIFEKDKF